MAQVDGSGTAETFKSPVVEPRVRTHDRYPHGQRERVSGRRKWVAHTSGIGSAGERTERADPTD